MAQDEQFEHESLQDTESIGRYLSALIDGFQSGRISLSSDGSEMVLTPDHLLQFSVKARKKGAKNKLSIKIQWKEQKLKISRENDIRIST
jgi:amphi-Trp domain-containing protein